MLLSCIATAFAGSYTLDEALLQAQRANLELASQRRGNAIVRYRLQSARSGFDPRLSASWNTNQSKTPSNNLTDLVNGQPAVITSTGTSWNVGVSQSLPTGGSVSVGLSESRFASDSANAASDLFVSANASVSFYQPLLRGLGQGALATLRDAHLDSAAQELSWRAQMEQTVLDISAAYWGLLSARESAEIAARGVELAEQQLAETLERQEAGFAGSGDVLQVRVSLGQARRTAVNARAAVGGAELQLARMLGLPLEEASSLELSDIPSIPDRLPTAEMLMSRAVEGNATLLLARIDFERAKRQARRSINRALPDLSLNGSAGWAAGGTDPAGVRTELVQNGAPSVGIGLSLGLPIIPRENLATAGIARLQLEQAEFALEAAEQDLVLRVNGVARDLLRDAGGLEAAQETRAYAVESLAAQRELLAEGRGSTRDVVDALESLRSAELSELNAKITLQASVFRARQVAGTLVRAEELD